MSFSWARPDLAQLRRLVEPGTPVASVFLTVNRADAPEDVALRRRGLIENLDRDGADPATRAAVRVVLEALDGKPGDHAVFASDGTVCYRRSMHDSRVLDAAQFGAPARVAPVLRWLLHHPPHVLVVMDRAGAEITTVPGGTDLGHTVTVVGPDDAIEDHATPGWSQPSYHRRAEDSWRHNAIAVADAAAAAARHAQAQLLLVAGDVRMVPMLREHLDREHRGLTVRHLPGGRSPDGSGDLRDAAAAAAVEQYVEQGTAGRLRDLSDVEPGRLGVIGAEQTIAALAGGGLGALFVVDDPTDKRTARFGPLTWCTLAHDDPATHPGRLVDVAIRAALLADAVVYVLDPGRADAPREGIGGICRYPT